MIDQIKILTRESLLARIQGKMVGDKIHSIFPKLKIIYHTSRTLGDLDQNLDLKSSESRGLFTGDISKQIGSGNSDIAVHSWKDYPIVNESKTNIVGTLSRADSRDMLFIKKDSVKKNFLGTLSVMTSSPRRIYGLEQNLNRLIPLEINNIKFKDLRGNIDTRLKKFMNSNNDAVIIAKAAIDRIIASKEIDSSLKDKIHDCLNSCHWIILPLSLFPTAAGQGAIGIETKLNNTEIVDIIGKINNETDFKDVQSERSIISNFGGGCSQKIGISILRKNGMIIKSLFGQTEAGEKLNFYGEIKPSTVSKKNYLTERDKMFPSNREEENIFKRFDYNRNEKIKLIDKSLIFITRSNVLKFRPRFKDSCILWTSGIKTWEAAAKNGYWINGSSDSLGEGEVAKIFNLFSKDLSVTKLTFKDESNNTNKIIDTYRLKEPKFPSDFEHRTHFYWMSSKIFKVAFEKYPNIKDKNHSCGMGNTYNNLREILGDRVKCFLSYNDWYNKTCKHEK